MWLPFWADHLHQALDAISLAMAGKAEIWSSPITAGSLTGLHQGQQ